MGKLSSLECNGIEFLFHSINSGGMHSGVAPGSNFIVGLAMMFEFRLDRCAWSKVINYPVCLQKMAPWWTGIQEIG